MRTVSRAHFYFKLLTWSSLYFKTNSIRSLSKPQSYPSSFINEQFTIQQRIKPLEILEPTTLPKKQKAKYNQIKKKNKTHKDLNNTKTQTNHTNHAKQQLSTLPESEQKSTDNQLEALDKQKIQKKTKKNKPAKKTKPIQTENQNKMGEENLEKKTEIETAVFEQYPALNYLKESLLKTNLKALPKPTFNWHKKEKLSLDEQNQNSQKFLKMIGHWLSKESCSRLIKIIEHYCRKNKTTVTEKISERKAEKLRENGQKECYKNIKRTLTKELLVAQMNEGGNSVEMLLNALNNTNPETITLQKFEEHFFLKEFEDKARRKVPGTIKIDGNFFEQFQEEDLLDEDSQEKVPLNNTVKNNDAFTKAYLLKNRPELAVAHSEKKAKKQLVMKPAPENLMFRQVIPPQLNYHKQLQSNKFVYLYDLPYNLTEQDGALLISHLQEAKNVKVSQYVLFPYKQFLESNKYQVVFRVPENYDEQRIEKVYTEDNIEDAIKNVARNNRKNDFRPEIIESEEEIDPLLSTAADLMLQKLKQQDYSRYNKSSMAIKLSSVAEKEKVISSCSRLFGINVGHLKNVKFQSAHCKVTLLLTGFPLGGPASSLAQALNTQLRKDMQIRVDEDCYLTQPQIQIQFVYFVDALKACQLLNNFHYQGKRLKVLLRYGPVCIVEGSYDSEVIPVQAWQQLAEVDKKCQKVFQLAEKECLL